MKELTAEQLESIRRQRGQADAKALARQLKVPRRQVEQALSALEPAPAERRLPWLKLALAAGLVLLAGVLGYGGNATYGFHFDDTHAIQGNDAIRTLAERTAAIARPDDSVLDRWRGFVRAVPPTAEAIYEFNFYRMVTYWSLALNYWAHGLEGPRSPEDAFTPVPHWGWHATNNAIHYLNGVLVLWVAYLTLTAPMFRSGRGVRYPLAVALLAAVVFVAHPMQTQAVTYLIQRTESLCGTFYLLALGLFISARLRSLGPKRGSAPHWTPVALGGAGILLAVFAVLARTTVLDLGGFLGACLLVLAAAVGAVVWLVQTGRDERGHAALTVGCFAAFAFGLQTKEIAATFPFVACVWDVLFVPAQSARAAAADPAPASRSPARWPWLASALRAGGWARLRYLGPWAAIVAAVGLLLPVFGGIGFASQLLAEGIAEGGGTGQTLSPGSYLLTQANVLSTYARKFILPFDLNLDHAYPRPTESFTAGLSTVLSLTLLAGAVGLVVWRGGRGRVAAFALLMGLAVLAPTSSVIVLPDVIYEHRFYLPLAGAALLSAVVVERLVRRLVPEPRQVGVLFGAAVIAALGLGLATRSRNEVWANEVTLWRDVTTKAATKPRAWTNLGLAYQAQEPNRIALRSGRTLWGQVRELPGDLVLVQPTTVLKGVGPVVLPRSELAVVEPRPGGLELARGAYREALAIDPDYPKALNNLALVSIYQRQTLIQELETIERDLLPRFTQAKRDDLVRAARERIEAGRAELERLFAEAERAFLRQVELGVNDDALLYSNIGNLYWTVARADDALPWIERALSFPKCPAEVWAMSGDLRYAQGIEAFKAGQRAEARGMWEDAIRRYDEYLKRSPRGGSVGHVRQMRERTVDYIAGRAEPNPTAPTSPFPPRR